MHEDEQISLNSGGRGSSSSAEEQQASRPEQQQFESGVGCLLHDPYILTFASDGLEGAYQRQLAQQCGAVDLPAAVMLFVMCVAGAAYAWTVNLADCLSGIIACSTLSSALQLAFALANQHQRQPCSDVRWRNWAVFGWKLLDCIIFATLGSKCRTFWDLNWRRYLQSLLWDSGALHLLMSAGLKPLPFKQLLLGQTLCWLIIVIGTTQPLCAKYGASDFYGPLLQRSYVLLTPMGMGVTYDPSNGYNIPSPSCCCGPVVLLVSFLGGLVVPLCVAHGLDYLNRKRFAAATAAAAGQGAQVLPWPWALEVCAAVVAHNIAWILVVVAVNGSACPLPQF